MILFYFIFRRNPTTKTYSHKKIIWFLLRKSCWNVGVWFKMYTGFIFYYYTAAVLCFLTHFLLLLLPWLFYTAVLEFQRSFTVVRCFHSSNALFFSYPLRNIHWKTHQKESFRASVTAKETYVHMHQILFRLFFIRFGFFFFD